ncbi:hypothetical protein ACU6HM_14100 [Alcaligenes sp. RM2]|uniref:hypothetical protein n=1 Tax=Alcaligenes TaxID=507 RepID=UPI0010083AD3|nr:MULTISPECIES: hypothetical protein [Alcaligenes]UTM03368.1 hypothetical protein MID00_08135 [Alcaligenes sp. NLF5-7]HRO21893.1 hypothetical protein [Alcaligenes phenolicus]HRP15532.1 hypothetical protein [Alcaligenes phenolicus]
MMDCSFLSKVHQQSKLLSGGSSWLHGACAPASGKQQEELQASQGTEQGRRPRAGLKVKNPVSYLLLTKISAENRKKSMCLPVFHRDFPVLKAFKSGMSDA